MLESVKCCKVRLFVDYMVPEQARDAKRGCSLRQHSSGPIPDLTSLRDGVPQLLAQAFRRMVAQKPEQRFESMRVVVDEFATELEVLAGTRGDIDAPLKTDDASNEETRLIDSSGVVRPQPTPRRSGLWMGVVIGGAVWELF